MKFYKEKYCSFQTETVSDKDKVFNKNNSQDKSYNKERKANQNTGENKKVVSVNKSNKRTGLFSCLKKFFSKEKNNI